MTWPSSSTFAGSTQPAEAIARGELSLIPDLRGLGIYADVLRAGAAGATPVWRMLLVSFGMALAIEPMVTLGRPQTEILDDDWTVVTVDGSLAAHFEHSIAITPDGPKVLTAARDDPRGLEL